MRYNLYCVKSAAKFEPANRIMSAMM